MRIKNLSFSFLVVLLIFSSNLKSQWSRVEGLYGGPVGRIMKDGSNLYAFNKNLYVSSDNANSWKVLKDFGNFTASTFDARGPNLLVGLTNEATFSLLSSSDYGETWSKLGGLPEGYFITKVLFYKDKIFAAIPSRGLFSSSNNGNIWDQITDIPAEYISGIVECNNSIFASGGSSIYRSEDEGVSWTEVFQSVIFSVVSNGHDLIAAASGEFYLSIDNGDS